MGGGILRVPGGASILKVVVVWCALTMLGPATAEPVLNRQVSVPDGEITVSWQANAAGDGVAFRLYRTGADGRPVLVAETNAQRGTRRYSVPDRVGPDEFVVYRLCAVSRDVELELGVLLRTPPTARPGDDATLHAASDASAVMPAMVRFDPPVAPTLPAAGPVGFADHTTGPDPPVPRT